MVVAMMAAEETVRVEKCIFLWQTVAVSQISATFSDGIDDAAL